MGDSVRSLAEVEVDNIHGSPLIYPAGHTIVESYQIGQAWFSLSESTLTTPDNLLFLHLLDDDLQDKLLHHLSQDGGEADRPLVPWVLLLDLFEDLSDNGFPPVLGHLSFMFKNIKGKASSLNHETLIINSVYQDNSGSRTQS